MGDTIATEMIETQAQAHGGYQTKEFYIFLLVVVVVRSFSTIAAGWMVTCTDLFYYYFAFKMSLGR